MMIKKRDDIHEATLLSLALHKTTKFAEEQENIDAVKEKILEEDVEKMVGGEDEESYANGFANSIFLDEEDSGTRLEPGSHKVNPEILDDDDNDDAMEKKDDNKDDNDDDDNDDHDDYAFIKNKRTGSSETRTKKMQTPIPLPHRSLRINLPSNKGVTQELTVFVSPTPATSSQDHSKPSSSRSNILPGSIAQMPRRSGQLW
ncbi:hypothetical protein Tco_0678323 [Tanacetum coccineum]|uniref:Uncharacterized protein n=1 Tax=Tanacetum coccineum TaxID=301880 RepID=A0ABQ4XER2_9ASTR